MPRLRVYPGVTTVSGLVANPLLLSRASATARDETVEAALVHRSQGGDREAFGLLVRGHERRVFRLASRFFRQRADVEEVAQETFLKAWTKLASFRSEAPFEHWLTRICLRCCYELLRRQRPVTEELDPEAPAAAVDLTAAVDVQRLLAKLSAADRFLLHLLEGEGWTTAEVAARTGWTTINVKVRAHRARARLRRMVGVGVEP